MKKRIFAILAAVFVLISTFPLAVFAEADCSHTNAVWYPVEGLDGYHYKWCRDCETELTEAEPCDAAYVSDGSDYHYLQCSVCKSQLSDLEPHSFDSGEYVDEGVQYTCVCDYQYIEHYHRFVYTSNGSFYHTVSCSLCDYSVQVVHDYGDPVYTPAEDGTLASNTYTCEQCGYVDVRYINPSHTCDETNFRIKYLDENTHEYTCPMCDKQFKVEVHQWDSGKVTQQPTADANGVRTFTCTLCKAIKTETIDYIDLDKLLEKMNQTDATDLYKKIFDKYQSALIKDSECMKPYVSEFVSVIFADIADKGARSAYFSDFEDIYYAILSSKPDGTSDYTKGYNDALKTIINENPVQGLFQGMWSGVVHFVTVVGNGITFGEVSLLSACSTLVLVALAFFLVKLLRGS